MDREAAAALRQVEQLKRDAAPSADAGADGGPDHAELGKRTDAEDQARTGDDVDGVGKPQDAHGDRQGFSGCWDDWLERLAHVARICRAASTASSIVFTVPSS